MTKRRTGWDGVSSVVSHAGSPTVSGRCQWICHAANVAAPLPSDCTLRSCMSSKRNADESDGSFKDVLVCSANARKSSTAVTLLGPAFNVAVEMDTQA